jgi:hypothetical protein
MEWLVVITLHGVVSNKYTITPPPVDRPREKNWQNEPKFTTNAPAGIKRQTPESPLYGAMLRHLEPFGSVGRL